MLINWAMLDVLSFAAVFFGRKPFSSWFSLLFSKAHHDFLVALFFLEDCIISSL